jgi:CheY-like chemotaxis protein
MRASIAIAVGAVASVTFFASFDAHACGESLFRVGRGVAYRAQTAPLPGNVLVVAPSAESKELAERLSAAGHKVRVVDSPEQVAQEIRSGKYDVVLASYNDRGLIETDSAGVAKAPAYIPVTTEDAQKALAAKAYPRYLSVDDDFVQYLRVIHRTLKAAPKA